MFQIDFSARIPIYEQLYYNVIKLASAGVIKPGDKLPPVRVIAAELGINPNTAAKAYRELEQDGYIFSSVGRGSKKRRDLRRRKKPADRNRRRTVQKQITLYKHKSEIY